MAGCLHAVPAIRRRLGQRHARSNAPPLDTMRGAAASVPSSLVSIDGMAPSQMNDVPIARFKHKMLIKEGGSRVQVGIKVGSDSGEAPLKGHETASCLRNSRVDQEKVLHQLDGGRLDATLPRTTLACRRTADYRAAPSTAPPTTCIVDLPSLPISAQECRQKHSRCHHPHRRRARQG